PADLDRRRRQPVATRRRQLDQHRTRGAAPPQHVGQAGQEQRRGGQARQEMEKAKTVQVSESSGRVGFDSGSAPSGAVGPTSPRKGGRVCYSASSLRGS